MSDATARPPRADATRRWPDDPAAFGDTTRCPSCFSPLSATVCGVCGLDLRVPAAAEVLASGRRLLAEETHRRELIDDMFRAQRAVAVGGADAPVRADASVEADASVRAATSSGAVGGAHTAVPVAPPSGPPVPLGPPTGAPVLLAPPTGPSLPAGAPPRVPAPTAASAPGAQGAPRRSGVQVFLLTLGVVLISVTAIVFLFVAYLVASLEVRSVIIAFASALVLGAAVLLRRRRLPGTAEGVSAVAVVLLLLDVWTVRANELFGTAELRPAAYTGVALLVVAAVIAGVRAVSGIRTLGVTAAVLAPLALFLLGVGVPEDDPTTALWLGGLFGLVGAVAAAVLHLPTAERVIALSSGMAGGVISWWAAAFALTDLPWHPLWAFAAVALVWAALLAALATRGRALGAGWRWVAAIATGGAVAAAPAVAVALELDVPVAAWLAPASAAAIAVLASLVLREQRSNAPTGDPDIGRTGSHVEPMQPAGPGADTGADATATTGARSSSLRRVIGLGLLAGSGAVAVLAAIPTGLAGALHVGTLLFDAIGGWTAGTVELTELAPATVVVPLVFAVAATLIALVLGRLRTLAWIPLALTVCGVVTLAVSFGDGVIAVVLLLALAALCLAAPVTVRTPLRGVVPVLATLGPASAALAWAAGFGAVDAWIWSTIGALALTAAGWLLAPRRWPAAASATAPVHAGLAALQVAVASIAITPWLAEAGVRLSTDWRSPAVWAALVCAVVFAAALALRGSQATVLAAAAPLLAVASIAVVILLVTGGSSVRWLPALVLAAGAAAWAWRGREAGLTAAAAAVAPAALTFAAAWFFGDVLTLAAQADAVAAGALLAGAALAHLLTRRSAAMRLAWAASTGVLTVTVVTIALLGGDWLPLALLAPVPVVLAALWGDPITSSAPMRHLAWASGALAVAAWWTWLADEGATTVELSTLPVAALCLAIGALIVARRTVPDRSRAAEFTAPPPVGEPTPGTTPAPPPVGESSIGGDSPRPAATTGRVTLLAAGLAVAVLPSVLAAGDSVVRTIVLVAAGAVMLLATAFAPDRIRGVPVGLLGALTGATAAVGGAVVHATAIALDDGGATLDWWALAGLVTGIAASIWWARADRRPARLAEWLLTGSALVASIPLIVAIVEGEAVELRTLALLSVLAVLHVAAAANAPRPFGGPIVRWGSAAALLVGAFVSLAAGVDPFDLAVVPVALALIGAGIFDLRRRPTLGSWAALGPGLAVLLLPPLLADFTDPQLWRIVALGVVALATLLAGIRWRLQAPFLLGGAVLLVHAVAQLWPWITWLYEAVWWWLWLGLAGVLLVVIAATYERQLRLARTTIGRISALR
jgi:hypothetical protein